MDTRTTSTQQTSRCILFFFSSRRRHTRLQGDWSSDVCSSDLNLLVIGQRAPAGGIPELGDLLRTHEVPSDSANDRELARVRIPRPSFYLLRPDGHVGLAGVQLDAGAVSRYVSERLRFG